MDRSVLESKGGLFQDIRADLRCVWQGIDRNQTIAQPVQVNNRLRVRSARPNPEIHVPVDPEDIR